MTDNVDEFLAHYGVPGMRRGVRKAGETKEARRAANRQTLRDFGKKRVAANGGSANKAIAKSVGKMAGINLLVNATVASLPAGGLKTGATVVGALVQLGSMAKGINEIRAVNESQRDSNK